SFPAAALSGTILAYFFVRLRPLRAQAAVFTYVWTVGAIIVVFRLGDSIALPWLWFLPIGLLFALCAPNVIVLPFWAWQVQDDEGRGDEPYLIVAASFLGQFASSAWPLWIEPNFPLQTQTIVWKVGTVLVAILIAGIALRVRTRNALVR